MSHRVTRDEHEGNGTGRPLEPLPYGGRSDSSSTGTQEQRAAGPGHTGDRLSRSTSHTSHELMGSPRRRLVSPAELSEQADAPLAAISGEEQKTSALQEIPGSLTDEVQQKYASITEAGQQARTAVASEDVERLTGEVSSLYERVTEELADSRHHSAEALGWLNEARTILLAYPEEYPRAELRVHQTRVLLRQVAFSDAAGERNIGLLVSWNLSWLLFLGGLFALDGYIAHTLIIKGVLGPPNLPAALLVSPSLTWFFPPWLSVLAGGIGGALGALILLANQKSRREYDPAYNLDFRLNAMKGAIWGGTIFYILFGGLVLATTTSPLNPEAVGRADQVQVASNPLFIIVAFVIGLAQSRALQLLGQLWDSRTARGWDRTGVDGASAPLVPPSSKEQPPVRPAEEATQGNMPSSIVQGDEDGSYPG